MNLYIFKVAQKKWAIFFSFSSLFLLGLADNIRGPLFPEILNYFTLSSSTGSLSFAITSMAAFFSSFLSGNYLKRFSISSLLQLSVCLMGLGLLLMGLSEQFFILLVGSFSLGLSFGFMGVSQNLLIAESFSTSDQSKALSGLHAMYGFASFFAPQLASMATDYLGQWRGAFIVVSVFCLLFFLIQLLVQPEPCFNVVKKNVEVFGSKDKVSKKSLIFVSGLLSFYVVAEILISTRLAQYMRTYFNMNLAESSRYVTFFFLFLLLGRLLFAFQKIRWPLRLQLNISLFVSAFLLVLGLKFHPFFLALVGLGMAPYYPLSIAYISEFAGPDRRLFITFAMGIQSLSVIAMHLGVGYLTDHWGLFYAFAAGLFALVLSWLCLNYHPSKK